MKEYVKNITVCKNDKNLLNSAEPIEVILKINERYNNG